MKHFGVPSSSLIVVVWFCAMALFSMSVLTYFQSNSVHRKHRMFHWLVCLTTFVSGIFYLMVASGGFGSVMTAADNLYWFIPLLLGTTVPIMLVALALFSGCSIIESRMLGACATLQYVCWLFCFMQSLVATYAESNNRWVWWIVQLVSWVPIGHALMNGMKTPHVFDEDATNKVGRLCSIMLLYYVIQQVFLLFTHAFRLINPSTEALGLCITHFLVVVIFGISMLNDTDVLERLIDSNAGLQLLSGAYEEGHIDGETSTMHHYDVGSGSGSGIEGASKVYRQEVSVLKPSRGSMSASEKLPLKGGPQQV